jgi:hypothetical protein
MLHEFVSLNRDAIIAACRVKVANRSDPPHINLAIDHGVPMFLDQLVDELRVGLSGNPEITRTASQHGHDLLHQGYTASQVVHGYGDVCQAITELALERGKSIGTDDFRMLNRCLDDAIAGAITQYGQERDRTTDGEAAAESDRIEDLALELRRLIETSAVATIEVIGTGRVGVSGSTGAVLRESLSAARSRVDRLLDEGSPTFSTVRGGLR